MSKNLNVTTTKTRLTNINGKHILRIDKEEVKSSPKLENNFLKNLKDKDLILIVDYKKGIINKTFIKKVKNLNNKIFVDPKNSPNIFEGAF